MQGILYFPRSLVSSRIPIRLNATKLVFEYAIPLAALQLQVKEFIEIFTEDRVKLSELAKAIWSDFPGFAAAASD